MKDTGAMSKRQRQMSQAYEALLHALAYVSTHDRSDDDRSVSKHIYDILKEEEAEGCPEVVKGTVHVKGNFESVSAEFLIDGEQIKESTEVLQRLVA